MSLTNKKFLVFVLFFCAAFLVLAALLFFNSPNNKRQNKEIIYPTITPVINKKSPSYEPLISKYSKTVIGYTPEKEVASYPGLIKQKKIGPNTTSFTYDSLFAFRNNEIVTKNGLVIYEKVITVNNSLVHPKISDFLNLYGPAEKEFTGSKTYGRFEKTYIYASRGFSLVGNPSTDEVDEIQTFLPTTVDNYLKNWGKDIDTSLKGEKI